MKRVSPSVDTRAHKLVVYDGANRFGSLVEVAAEFRAFDLEGRSCGAFPTMLRAARSIPAVESAS